MVLHLSFLLSTCIVQCMDSPQTDSTLITSSSLQKLVTQINNSSFHIVNIIKERAEHCNLALEPQNIAPLFGLNQENINRIFLDNVDDDQLRPLTLSMGADIKARAQGERNCLFFTEKPEALTQLLDKGAEVDAINEHGATPLRNLLTWSSSDRIAAARVLLAHGANPNVPWIANNSLLHIAAEDVKLGVATLLCEYKANTNAQDSLGRTPLMLAIEKGATDIVRVLLTHNANADLPDQFGRYPLHMAILQEQTYSFCNDKKKIIPAIVILLLQHGANPNRPYPHGKQMPLHRAVEIGNMEIIQPLIDYKAETHHLDDNERTPLMIAKRFNRSPEIIALLSAVMTMPAQTVETPDDTISTQPNTHEDTPISGSGYATTHYPQGHQGNCSLL